VQLSTAVTLPCEGASRYPLIGWPSGPTATALITWVGGGSAIAGPAAETAAEKTAITAVGTTTTRDMMFTELTFLVDSGPL
jgi:hypothetical protein